VDFATGDLSTGRECNLTTWNAMSRTILMLGGYGNAGVRIARLLLRESDVRLVLAGRSAARAGLIADRLNRESKSSRVSGTLVDVAEPRLLRKALDGVDLLVMASSTVAQTAQSARVAIDAQVDWFDIQSAERKLVALRALREEIEEAGRCFITDGGFHPGLPAALVRFGSTFLDRLQRASIGMALKLDWRELEVSAATIREFVEEVALHRPQVFDHGEWKASPSWRTRAMAFGAPIGRRRAAPVMVDELRGLPEQYPALIELNCWAAGFNWFVDWVGFGAGGVALRALGQRAVPAVSRVVRFGLRRFSRPPWGAIMLVEAGGWKKGRLVGVRGAVSHWDAYELTAIPAAATLLQYLDGSIRRPGLWQQGLVVDPRRFMADLERLGATVEYGLDVQTGGTTGGVDRKRWGQ
jgi:saccharopine dehydrogenase (NAD+, L-lysine-forming)